MKRFLNRNVVYVFMFMISVTLHAGYAVQAKQITRIVDVVKILGNQPRECVLCADEKVAHRFLRLQCEHEYCRDCLAMMLDIALREKKTAELRCPGCKIPFVEQDIRNIRNSQQDVDAIAKIKTLEWLLTQPGTKQCPTVGCENVFIVDGNEPVAEIVCPSCRQKYCNQCLLKHDRTLSCAQAKALAPTDTATAKFIEQDTKPCPFCHARVHRISGCSRIRCASCHNEFCWNCLLPFGRYGFHNYFGAEGSCKPLEAIRERIIETEHLLIAERELLRLNPAMDRFRLEELERELQNFRDIEEQFLAFQAKQAKLPKRN